MAATEQQHERALEKFLDARPDLRVELDNLNPLLAQAKGETARSIAPSACMKHSKPRLSIRACSLGN